MKFRIAVIAAAIAVSIAAVAGRADALQPAVESDTSAAEERPTVPSPGGVFLRQVLVPGWGHAALNAYGRGSVYFAARVASGFMLFKTIARLGDARDLERRHTAAVRDSLLALAAADTAFARQLERPGALDAAIEEHPDTKGLRDLVGSREQQREDWITWNLFWLLISGVDAFVTAHLADFPAQVTGGPGSDGGVRLQIRVPVPTPP